MGDDAEKLRNNCKSSQDNCVVSTVLRIFEFSESDRGSRTMWNIAQETENLSLDIDMFGFTEDISVSLPIRSMIYYVYIPAFLPAFAMLYYGAFRSCRKRACGSSKSKAA